MNVAPELLVTGLDLHEGNTQEQCLVFCRWPHSGDGRQQQGSWWIQQSSRPWLNSWRFSHLAHPGWQKKVHGKDCYRWMFYVESRGFGLNMILYYHGQLYLNPSNSSTSSGKRTSFWRWELSSQPGMALSRRTFGRSSRLVWWNVRWSWVQIGWLPPLPQLSSIWITADCW